MTLTKSLIDKNDTIGKNFCSIKKKLLHKDSVAPN